MVAHLLSIMQFPLGLTFNIDGEFEGFKKIILNLTLSVFMWLQLFNKLVFWLKRTIKEYADFLHPTLNISRDSHQCLRKKRYPKLVFLVI